MQRVVELFAALHRQAAAAQGGGLLSFESEINLDAWTTEAELRELYGHSAEALAGFVRADLRNTGLFAAVAAYASTVITRMG